ncbi:hypothetical protein CR513_01523, partial [Mucuna pruriens]
MLINWKIIVSLNYTIEHKLSSSIIEPIPCSTNNYALSGYVLEIRKKQLTIAKSSSEEEYMALDLGIKYDRQYVIYNDNQNALYITTNMGKEYGWTDAIASNHFLGPNK